MPVYQYKGLTTRGKATQGVVEADGPGELRSRLVQQGIYVTEFSEAREGAPAKAKAAGQQGSWLSREVEVFGFLKRVKLRDVAVMTRQFGTLLRAGIPITEALGALVAQTENQRLKVIVTSVREKVREGSSLADALAAYPSTFSRLYVNMVRVGEASGTLDLVLLRLADFLESSVKLRAKIISAMIYPVLMLCVASLIVSIMMLFVIPKMTEMFEDMGGKLPLVTRVLIFISHAFASTWYLAIPLLVAAFLYFRRYVRTEKGRRWFDAMKLKVPVFSPVVRLVAVARFARTLSTLLSSGVPVLTALDIVKAVLNNVVMGEAVDEAKAAVREGESLAAPLQKSNQFPPMMTHMIAIGEKTGELESMLATVADAYDAEVDARVTTLTAVLEPLMIVGMGLMVSFLVFAILTPMLQMNEVIAGQ